MPCEQSASPKMSGFAGADPPNVHQVAFLTSREATRVAEIEKDTLHLETNNDASQAFVTIIAWVVLIMYVRKTLQGRILRWYPLG